MVPSILDDFLDPDSVGEMEDVTGRNDVIVCAYLYIDKLRYLC